MACQLGSDLLVTLLRFPLIFGSVKYPVSAILRDLCVQVGSKWNLFAWIPVQQSFGTFVFRSVLDGIRPPGYQIVGGFAPTSLPVIRSRVFRKLQIKVTKYLGQVSVISYQLNVSECFVWVFTPVNVLFYSTVVYSVWAVAPDIGCDCLISYQILQKQI